MTKLSIVAAVGLVAVLPAPASASVSGWVQCQQGQAVQTYVQGYGWYHDHQLNGSSAHLLQNDPIASYYTIVGWNPVSSGNWQVSASTTTTYGAGYCA